MASGSSNAASILIGFATMSIDYDLSTHRINGNPTRVHRARPTTPIAGRDTGAGGPFRCQR
jgi:hypothetical protein